MLTWILRDILAQIDGQISQVVVFRIFIGYRDDFLVSSKYIYVQNILELMCICKYDMFVAHTWKVWQQSSTLMSACLQMGQTFSKNHYELLKYITAAVWGQYQFNWQSCRTLHTPFSSCTHDHDCDLEKCSILHPDVSEIEQIGWLVVSVLKVQMFSIQTI